MRLTVIAILSVITSAIGSKTNQSIASMEFPTMAQVELTTTPTRTPVGRRQAKGSNGLAAVQAKGTSAQGKGNFT